MHGIVALCFRLRVANRTTVIVVFRNDVQEFFDERTDVFQARKLPLSCESNET